MDFTIEFTSGGNHGHQLKDALGGLTIGRLFDLNYVHTPYEYLDFFGIGYTYKQIKKEERQGMYKHIKRVSGPLWCGIDAYDKMYDYFKEKLLNVEENTLIILDNALRIHPFQTIPWYEEGRLKYDICSAIQQELSDNFIALHSLTLSSPKKPIDVVVHINRGMDYDREIYPQHFTSPYAVRFMFPMDYYENIMVHIEKAYGIGNVNFKIYTEELNSEDITGHFNNRANTQVLLGTNREKKNYDLVHSIYQAFVEADILVCSNSSFSVMCSYFRKGRKTIYHPHLQLRYLEEPFYIGTDDDGAFDIQLLEEEVLTFQ